MIRKLIILLAIASPLAGQTYSTVAPEGSTLIATSTVTVRYGVASGTTNTGKNCALPAGCWAAPVTILGKISVANGKLLDAVDVTGDPAPGLAKVLQVLETSVMQSVTVNGATIIVPALPPVVAPPSGFTASVTSSTCAPPAADKSVTCTVVVQIKAAQ